MVRPTPASCCCRPLRCAALLAVVLAAGEVYAQPREGEQDNPNVVRNPGDFRDDPEHVSQPSLGYPIYACANSVVVSGFVYDAKLTVLIDGAPVASVQGQVTSGQPIEVPTAFTADQVVTATQEVGGVTSDPSNAVTVTSHTADYPAGLPRPRIAPAPPLQCGAAIGIADTVPGAWVKVISERAMAGGGFDPPQTVADAQNNHLGYQFVAPDFERDARISVQSGICTDLSVPSLPEIVDPEPASVPAPTLDDPIEDLNIVTVRGPGGPPATPLAGARLDVFADNLPPGSNRVGGQPTPGGGGQQVLISPPVVEAVKYTATQALCMTSPPSDPVAGLPCESLPAPIVKPPVPGDTVIELIDYEPGAQILVFADGTEIGHGGGPKINVDPAVVDGQQLTVIQATSTGCQGAFVWQSQVTCPFGGTAFACNGQWPAFRHDGLRTGRQPIHSAIADPYRVKTLAIDWTFTPSGARGFRASPVVWRGRVHIGNANGYLYTLDANTGALLWQFPKAGDPPLRSQFESNPSSHGIAASVAIGLIGGEREVVILGAPDPSIGAGLGSGRLFALRPDNGDVVWASDEVAVLNGLTASATNELHEQMGYSSPLVHQDRVVVGIANHGDNPIQNGRVAAVDLPSGAASSGFGFVATGTRGGGIWSSVAGGLEGQGIYVTTGNTRCWNGGCQDEPRPNHGLSLLRLDPATGNLVWKLQPVPFDLDDDPDWAAGPSLARTACGDVVVSTMKDGWSYAVNAGTGAPGAAAVRYQFPPTALPFAPGDGTVHGDSRYLVSGAAWDGVHVTMTGGEEIVTDIDDGFNKLHALDMCAGRDGRVRWIADVPGASPGGSYRLGPPTVARGIVYVGTHQGHLVAIADPSVWPAQGSRCSHTGVATADCLANGFQLVPRPSVLLDLDLDPANGSDSILTEPVPAGGRVFVATGAGTVYMLRPRE